MKYLFVTLFGIFWFVRQIKSVLFWTYLWQLKEYQVRRFKDHFRTAQGKQIFLNAITTLKAVFAFILAVGFFYLAPQNLGVISFSFQVVASIIVLVLVLYALEAATIVRNLYLRRLKKPVFTVKTIILVMAALAVDIVLGILFFERIHHFVLFVLLLLLVDIFSPLIVTLIILFFQVFTVLLRNRVLKKAAKKRLSIQNLCVVGITGSYGKTSTKEFLSTILSTKFKVLATKDHQNSEIGIARCILKELAPEHEVFIAEMGSYGKGGIKLLCNLIMPTIGVVTGVNQQHLGVFGSMENLLSAEGGQELADQLPQDGLLVVNGENEHCLALYQRTNKLKKLYKRYFESSVDKYLPDLYATDIKVARETVVFTANAKNGEQARMKIKMLGAHNVLNILAAACVAQSLGMSLQEIASACAKIQQSHGAMRLFRASNGFDVIDASYSANPDGVIAALDYMRILDGKKAIIMPCLIELGSASKDAHHRIGEKIGQVCDLAIITTKERFKEIKEGAQENGMPESSIVFLERPEEILAKIKKFCASGDVVLLQGRVPKEVVERLKRHI